MIKYLQTSIYVHFDKDTYPMDTHRIVTLGYDRCSPLLHHQVNYMSGPDDVGYPNQGKDPISIT